MLLLGEAVRADERVESVRAELRVAADFAAARGAADFAAARGAADFAAARGAAVRVAVRADRVLAAFRVDASGDAGLLPEKAGLFPTLPTRISVMSLPVADLILAFCSSVSLIRTSFAMRFTSPSADLGSQGWDQVASRLKYRIGNDLRIG
jgi:hypothetical protein